MLKRIFLVSFPLILIGCSTASPVKVTTVQPLSIPPELIKPCPKKQRGELKTTNDLVNRLVYTEAALDRCSAQIDGIAALNKVNVTDKVKK